MNSRIGNMLLGGGGLIITTNLWFGLISRLIGATFGSVGNQRAINYSGGILCARNDPYASGTLQSAIEWVGSSNVRSLANPTDTEMSSQLFDKQMQWGSAIRKQMTQAVEEFIDQTATKWRIITRRNTNTLDMTGYPVEPSMTLDVMSFSIAVATNVTLLPGDFLTQTTTGTVFLIETVAAPSGGIVAVTSRQQNNMQIDPDTLAMTINRNPDPTFTSKLFLLIQCGPVLMSQVSFGTFTAASVNVTAVSRGDGYGGNTASFYSVGDVLVGFPFVGSSNADKWPITDATFNTLATVVNGSPASMTLANVAGQSGDFPIYPLPIAR